MTMDEFDRETARLAAEKAAKLAHYAPTEERRKAVRRWFGWWETNKATWTKRVDEPEPESWEELTGEEEEDGKKDK